MVSGKIVSSLALVAAVVMTVQAASASVVLVSSTAPAVTANSTVGSTVNTIVDFTAQGTLDWMDYAGAPRAATPYAGNERAGLTLFSPISTVGPTSGTQVSGGGYTAAQGMTLVYSNGTSPTTNGGGSAGNTYVRGGVVNDGLTFTYSIAPNSTQLISVYVENYDATGIFNLSSAASGSLYQDAVSVALPSSDGTGGVGHGAGVYTFTVTNTSASSDTLTFTYLIGSVNGASDSVGIEGVTVSTVSAVPEPTTFGILGLAVTGLLARRSKKAAR